MLRKFLSLYAFQRAITSYDPCGTPAGTFVPEAECLDEGSRIIGAFLVKTSLDLESLIDDEAIDAAITAGDLKVVRDLAGNWVAGTSNKKPGKGYNREKHSSFTYAIPFSHYGVDANLTFWNTINRQKDWSVIFVFEDLGAWGALDNDKKPIPMDITVSPSSTEDLGGTRQMEGIAGWTTPDLPYVLLAPVIAGFTKAELSNRFKLAA